MLRSSGALPASAPERDQRFFRLFYPSRAKSDDPKAFKNEGVRSAGKYRLQRNAAKEEEIAAGLRRFVAGRTVLLMTHRLRAAQAADTLKKH